MIEAQKQPTNHKNVVQIASMTYVTTQQGHTVTDTIAQK